MTTESKMYQQIKHEGKRVPIIRYLPNGRTQINVVYVYEGQTYFLGDVDEQEGVE